MSRSEQTLKLKSGAVLKGVVTDSGDTYTVRTQHGELYVPKADVAELEGGSGPVGGTVVTKGMSLEEGLAAIREQTTFTDPVDGDHGRERTATLPGGIEVTLALDTSGDADVWMMSSPGGRVTSRCFNTEHRNETVVRFLGDEVWSLKLSANDPDADPQVWPCPKGVAWANRILSKLGLPQTQEAFYYLCSRVLDTSSDFAKVYPR